MNRLLSNDSASPKIALVYDWLNTQYGGAEQLISHLHRAFPTAPIFTTIHNRQKTSWSKEMNIETSWLQRLPFAQSHHHLFSPFMPLAIESHDLEEFEIVISISSSIAKGVITKPHQLHLCYLLTPTRYLHHPESLIENEFSWMKFRLFTKAFSGVGNYLKRWDAVAANRPDFIIPISKLVSERISQVYEVPCSNPLYPPVSIAKPSSTLTLPEKTVLSISRLVSYKKIDDTIRACVKLGWPLIIAGEGRALRSLVQLAGDQSILRKGTESLQIFIDRAKKLEKSILFTKSCTADERLQLLYSAEYVVTPGVEDYGMSSLEAVLAGCKLVTNSKSGSSELLEQIPGVSLLDDPNAYLIAEALQKLINQPKPELATKVKKTLNPNSFLKEFSRIVYDAWQLHQKV